MCLKRASTIVASSRVIRSPCRRIWTTAWRRFSLCPGGAIGLCKRAVSRGNESGSDGGGVFAILENEMWVGSGRRRRGCWGPSRQRARSSRKHEKDWAVPAAKSFKRRRCCSRTLTSTFSGDVWKWADFVCDPRHNEGRNEEGYGLLEHEKMDQVMECIVRNSVCLDRPPWPMVTMTDLQACVPIAISERWWRDATRDGYGGGRGSLGAFDV